MMPELSYALESLLRITAVRRSMASATTLGDGGRGTFCAKAKAEERGVRATERARVIAGSTSGSISLEENVSKIKGNARRILDLGLGVALLTMLSW